MGMKFLNKKGWHTGSLRNIENVWKAEQKHDAEQRKLEELRKQIHEEREKSEFRLLQEQAGLVPKQERLDFLYDSGLAVGKASSSDGFKSLESLPPKAEPESSASANKSAPGALFEDKPQSANDAWRKLHSDPLLMIKQREQEALARVKNNPVQMAMIRKSVEAKKQKDKTSDKEKEKHHHRKKKSKHTSSKHRVNSDEEEEEEEERNHLKHKDRFQTDRHQRENYNTNVEERSTKHRVNSDDEEEDRNRLKHKDHFQNDRRKRESYNNNNNVEERSTKHRVNSDGEEEERNWLKHKERSQTESRKRESYSTNNNVEERFSKHRFNSKDEEKERSISPSQQHSKHKDERERYNNVEKRYESENGKRDRRNLPPTHNNNNRVRRNSTEVSKEERAAKLKEMQMDAELHEEQRWRRLKQAEDDDAKEVKNATSSGKNFLDVAHKSIYGAEKGGSSTIEESVRRRTHYSQKRTEGNAFRR